MSRVYRPNLWFVALGLLAWLLVGLIVFGFAVLAARADGGVAVDRQHRPSPFIYNNSGYVKPSPTCPKGYVLVEVDAGGIQVTKCAPSDRLIDPER